jgi:hypothetical protein
LSDSIVDARAPVEIQAYRKEAKALNVAMGIDQAGQNIPASSIDMRCLRIFIAQRRISRSDDSAIFGDDQNTKLTDAGLSRGIAGETVEYSFRCICRPAKA